VRLLRWVLFTWSSSGIFSMPTYKFIPMFQADVLPPFKGEWVRFWWILKWLRHQKHKPSNQPTKHLHCLLSYTCACNASLSCDKDTCNYNRDWACADDFPVLVESRDVVMVRTCDYKDNMFSWGKERWLDGCRVWSQRVWSRRLKDYATCGGNRFGDIGHPWGGGGWGGIFCFFCSYPGFNLNSAKTREAFP